MTRSKHLPLKERLDERRAASKRPLRCPNAYEAHVDHLIAGIYRNMPWAGFNCVLRQWAVHRIANARRRIEA